MYGKLLLFELMPWCLNCPKKANLPYHEQRYIVAPSSLTDTTLGDPTAPDLDSGDPQVTKHFGKRREDIGEDDI